MPRALLAIVALPALFALPLRAQFLITRTFMVNASVPDFGELANAQSLAVGGGTIQNVQVGLTLSSAPSGGPMFNGDIYASLGHGTGFAVLLNRVGRTSTNSFGYSDAGIAVTFNDAAPAGNIHTYQTTLGGAPAGGALTGTWAPDGRNVLPSTVTNTTPSTATLASFNGLSPDGEWRLLVSDESGGSVAQLVSWSLRLVVNPPASGPMQFANVELAPSTSAPLSFPNQVEFTGTNTITSSFDVFMTGGLTGSGTLTKTGASRLVLPNADNYAGALTVTGGTVEIYNGFGGTGGAITIGAGVTLTGAGTVTRAFSNGGIVAGPTDPGQFLTFSGAVTGAGSYAGRIAMHGSFSPGNSAAVVTFTDALALGSTNLLTMEIGGPTAGTGYDQLRANTIAFGGTLQVSLINGYTPSLGQSFQLFSANSYTSAFTTQQLALLPTSLQWDTGLLTTNGTLSVVASAIPEPSTYAMLAGGAMFAAALWRRRKCSAGILPASAPMQARSRRSLSRRLACGLLALVATVRSLTAADTSDPVGVFRLRLRGNSDTIVSLPLQRPALLEATIASRTGNALQLSSPAPALPAEGAFALVMSGPLEGAVLPIVGVSGSTVTIDAAGFDLAPLRTTAANGASLADIVAVVPYWTLDTLFPQGRGVHVSPTASQRSTEILLFDDSVAGVNHSAAALYYYFVGSQARAAGWYQVGGAVALGQTRFPPHRYFIVRHRTSTDSTLDIIGGVQMSGFRLPLRTVTAATDQDNLIGLPVAQAVRLKDSKLIESGAFRVSSSASVRTDELLVFDNTVVGFNKSASALYYYFSGSESRVAGWYQVGTTTLADNILLRPGQGYVVRKRNPTGPSRTVWSGLPTYLQ